MVLILEIQANTAQARQEINQLNQSIRGLQQDARLGGGGVSSTSGRAPGGATAGSTGARSFAEANDFLNRQSANIAERRLLESHIDEAERDRSQRQADQLRSDEALRNSGTDQRLDRESSQADRLNRDHTSTVNEGIYAQDRAINRRRSEADAYYARIFKDNQERIKQNRERDQRQFNDIHNRNRARRLRELESDRTRFFGGGGGSSSGHLYGANFAGEFLAELAFVVFEQFQQGTRVRAEQIREVGNLNALNEGRELLDAEVLLGRFDDLQTAMGDLVIEVGAAVERLIFDLSDAELAAREIGYGVDTANLGYDTSQQFGRQTLAEYLRGRITAAALGDTELNSRDALRGFIQQPITSYSAASALAQYASRIFAHGQGTETLGLLQDDVYNLHQLQFVGAQLPAIDRQAQIYQPTGIEADSLRRQAAFNTELLRTGELTIDILNNAEAYNRTIRDLEIPLSQIRSALGDYEAVERDVLGDTTDLDAAQTALTEYITDWGALLTVLNDADTISNTVLADFANLGDGFDLDRLRQELSDLTGDPLLSNAAVLDLDAALQDLDTLRYAWIRLFGREFPELTQDLFRLIDRQQPVEIELHPEFDTTTQQRLQSELDAIALGLSIHVPIVATAAGSFNYLPSTAPRQTVDDVLRGNEAPNQPRAGTYSREYDAEGNTIFRSNQFGTLLRRNGVIVREPPSGSGGFERQPARAPSQLAFATANVQTQAALSELLNQPTAFEDHLIRTAPELNAPYSRAAFGDDPFQGRTDYPWAAYGPDRADVDGVQRDHLVSFYDAWRSGAANWTPEQRARFASDPRNIYLTGAEYNQNKGGYDAAGFLDPRNPASAETARLIIEIKSDYGLSIDPAEAIALNAALNGDPAAAAYAGNLSQAFQAQDRINQLPIDPNTWTQEQIDAYYIQNGLVTSGLAGARGLAEPPPPPPGDEPIWTRPEATMGDPAALALSIQQGLEFEERRARRFASGASILDSRDRYLGSLTLPDQRSPETAHLEEIFFDYQEQLAEIADTLRNDTGLTVAEIQNLEQLSAALGAAQETILQRIASAAERQLELQQAERLGSALDEGSLLRRREELDYQFATHPNQQNRDLAIEAGFWTPEERQQYLDFRTLERRLEHEEGPAALAELRVAGGGYLPSERLQVNETRQINVYVQGNLTAQEDLTRAVAESVFEGIRNGEVSTECIIPR